MINVESDPSRHLVKFTIVGQTDAEAMQAGIGRLKSLLAEVQPGFTFLADLTEMQAMPVSMAPQVAEFMEVCAQHGVEAVIRVLPSDPRNDIGFGILSHFHYPRHVRIFTCETVEEAMDLLSEAC